MSKEILISICAREGSKGIPKKNMKELNGKPLIWYTLEIAKKINSIIPSKIALSTDSSDIIDYCFSQGIETDYKRPKELALDNSGKIDTIFDLINYQENILNRKFEIILDLDVSSPLRTWNDILDSYKKFLKNRDMLTMVSVNEANRNPYFNMVEKENDTGFCRLVKTPDKLFLSRQEAPKVYELNASFYWYRRIFFNSKNKTPITEKTGIYKMNHICFDLDHPIDFKIMDYLVSNNEFKFF
tara:strand:- start:895 stop:1620 length:726 start_codon:yes stop_codon:yes gene_type:complete